jgi:hypothetical protein
LKSTNGVGEDDGVVDEDEDEVDEVDEAVGVALESCDTPLMGMSVVRVKYQGSNEPRRRISLQHFGTLLRLPSPTNRPTNHSRNHN